MMRQLVTAASVITWIGAAGAGFAYLGWLVHLNSYCSDSRSGNCARLDHPFGTPFLIVLVLWLSATALYVFATRVRPGFASGFMWAVLTLQVAWLIGFVGFRARYQHPHAGGQTCLDECLGAAFNFWGWIVLETVLLPLVFIAIGLLVERSRSWLARERLY